MDSEGWSHIFTAVESTPSFNQENSKTSTPKLECHKDVCLIRQKDINGTVNFLQAIAKTVPFDAPDFYKNIDTCMYKTRHEYLGHALHCSSESLCNSLLRPAKIVSCHFSHLRSLIRRVYDARRLSLDINGVKTAMSGGSYDTLQVAMTFLDQTLSCIRGPNPSPTDFDCDSNNTTQVTEDDIMEQYGQSLRHVAELRDHYITTVCDVCEQLRSDVRTLKSYENCNWNKSWNCYIHTRHSMKI